jgi:predicted ATPase
MIKKVRVKNFKIHKDCEFDFAPLTVLTGINSSGKSSLISAVLLHQTSQIQGKDPLSLNGNGLNLCDFTSVISTEHSEDFFEISVTDQSEKTICYRYESAENGRTVKICPQKQDSAFKNRIVYISPIRGLNLNYTKLSEKDYIDHLGENAAELIALTGNKKIRNKTLINKEYAPWLYKQIEACFKEMGFEIGVAANIYRDIAYIEYKQHGENRQPSNIGFGISYVLPVITAALMADKGDILIIDSPESHLHPMAQSSLGKFLGKVANSGVQIILETHSDHIVNGIHYAAVSKEHPLKKEELLFYFFNNNGFDKVTVGIDGRLNPTPEGFFDQIQNDLLKILRARVVE